MKTAGAMRRVSGVIGGALVLCMLALPLTAVGQAKTDAERFVGDYTLISCLAQAKLCAGCAPRIREDSFMVAEPCSEQRL